MAPPSEGRTQRVTAPALTGAVAGVAIVALLLHGPILVILLALGAVVGVLTGFGVVAAGNVRRGAGDDEDEQLQEERLQEVAPDP